MQLSVELIIAPSLVAASLAPDIEQQSSDVQHIVVDQLNISIVRSLIEQAHSKAVSREERVFVIVAQSIPTEAQNALLKLFEEPPANVRLLLIIPYESLLLPTLRSRFPRVTIASQAGQTTEGDWFLQADLADRLEEVAKRAKEKDLSWMQSVVQGLSVSVNNLTDSARIDTLESLSLIDSYLASRGANRKMLLEELALSTPVIRA